MSIKRMPLAGEVWETRDGSVVAVTRMTTSVPGGGIYATMIWSAGAQRTDLFLDLDGRFNADAAHELDLVKYVANWRQH